MDELKRALELWAIGLVRKELAQDCEYSRAKEEQDRLWEQFKAEQPKGAVRAHLTLLDLESENDEREGDALFWLGLRLGVLAGSVGWEV